MKKIIIKIIPDTQQRYNTVGDYYTNAEGEEIIAVSDMNNWKYEILVSIHELIESTLCQDRKVSEAQIDEFDLAFEKERLTNPQIGEPGNCQKAPYYNEHQFATKIEKMMAEQLNVDWDEYNDLIHRLDNNTEVL